VGHLELAHDYVGEAALMDLHNLKGNTRDGLHVASLAGAWIALVAGFGGMRDHGGTLSFAPRLPARIDRLDFALLWRGLRLRVKVLSHEATYFLRDHEGGGEISLMHHGEQVTVTVGAPVTRPIPPAPEPGPRPRQPAGREPRRRDGLDGQD
jgi:alpha,alpha-trehalose phosphorylase